jgi:hypothetical protein
MADERPPDSPTDTTADSPTAPSSPAGASSTGATTALTGDWPVQAADAVVDLVDTVRQRTVEPLLKIARAVVYGLLVVVAGVTSLLLVVILGIRMLDVYLPGDVWSAYLLLGSLFTLLGIVCWAKRPPRTA